MALARHLPSLRANDFRLRAAHGRGIDWPISYDELEPFYGEAEHEIGVAGDSDETLGSQPKERHMVRVVGIDHLVISVGDFEKSKEFYAPLMEFLGFGVEAEYEGSMMGWANGNTLFWIAAADAEGKKHKYRKGDIGFHHYAFRLRSRADVDALQGFLEKQGATIVDPAGEYYDDYYAVFFLDPDGMKLEGMKYGEKQELTARTRARRKKASSRTRPLR